MKRRGKSPPPRAQARGHEKPHAVQDRTGGIGSPAQHAAQAATPSGYWSQSARTPLRRKAWSETNDRPGNRRKPAAGQNPAYSHQPLGGAPQTRRASGHFINRTILPNPTASLQLGVECQLSGGGDRSYRRRSSRCPAPRRTLFPFFWTPSRRWTAHTKYLVSSGSAHVRHNRRR